MEPGFHISLSLFFVLFLLLSLFPSNTYGGETMRMTNNDNGKEITVSIGDTVELSLTSHGATGYLWQFTFLDPEYIELLSEETVVAPSKAPLETPAVKKTGEPTTHLWKLKLKKEGRTELRMAYFRPWEDAGKAADNFKVYFLIQ